MLLDPVGWSLSFSSDRLIPQLSEALAPVVRAETHAAVLELATQPHRTVRAAAGELHSLRCRLEEEVGAFGGRVASAGTHPTALGDDTVISGLARYQLVYDSMREIARREPTFALHVHVGVETSHDAIRAANQLRAHLPVLLALSANSPFWRGRDSGLASARTPLFQAFPRVGVPRRFRGYSDYVESVDRLIRSGAIPEPTFLWWDVRPQPRFGTVEVRVMDAQTTVGQTAGLAALVQSLVRLELERGFASMTLVDAQETIEENRFIAARDGMDARFVAPDGESLVPAREQFEALLAACEPHARALGCEAELAALRGVAAENGAARQMALARDDGLEGIVPALAADFCAAPLTSHAPEAAAERLSAPGA